MFDTQDIAFRDVVTFLKSSLACDEQNNSMLEKLYKTVDREFMETNTSVDLAWEKLRMYIGNKVNNN